MTPEAIRALIHEHRVAGRFETVLALESMLRFIEALSIADMPSKELRRVHWLADQVARTIERAREVLA